MWAFNNTTYLHNKNLKTRGEMFLYQRAVAVFPALKIQCSSSTFYLLEEIGGYVLECRGMLQVKVSRHTSHLNTGSTGSTGSSPVTLCFCPSLTGERRHGDLLVEGEEDASGHQGRRR